MLRAGYASMGELNIRRSRGAHRYATGSGPFALNAEPERGVRFGQLPNLEPERAFSALVAGKCISHALASAETPAYDKISSRKFTRRLRDNKPSSHNIETALNLPQREGSGSAFERACSPPNAEPNLRFRFKHLLNLNAERASGSDSESSLLPTNARAPLKAPGVSALRHADVNRGILRSKNILGIGYGINLDLPEELEDPRKPSIPDVTNRREDLGKKGSVSKGEGMVAGEWKAQTRQDLNGCAKFKNTLVQQIGEVGEEERGDERRPKVDESGCLAPRLSTPVPNKAFFSAVKSLCAMVQHGAVYFSCIEYEAHSRLGFSPSSL
ncbi:hypothetical protein C8R44DRAFT_726196 [Mycena epipterygia]|nr:hypothetical protein C8R44DRAFT_726196 [Mycena epipterygia]